MHPLDIVLRSRRSKWSTMTILVAGTLGIVFGLGGPIWAYLSSPMTGVPDPLEVVTAVLGCILLIFLPAVTAANDSRVLQLMRRGRFLQELTITGLRPQDVVDRLARHSVFMVLRVAVPLYAVLLMIWSRKGSEAIHWLPAVVMLTLGFSYLSQLLALWKAGEKSWEQVIMLAGLGLVTVVPMGAIQMYDPHLEIESAIVAGIIGLLLCRWLVILHLRYGESGPHIVRQLLKRLRPRQSNAYLQSYTANAIERRKTAQDASRVPGGPLGAFIYRYGVAIGLMAVLMAVLMAADTPLQFRILLATCYVGSIQLLRTFHSASQAMAQERDERTLDQLQLTPLTSREFVDGLAIWAAAPRLIETLIVAAMLAVVTIAFLPPSEFINTALFGLASLGLGLIHLVMAAYLGIAIGSRCRSLLTIWVGAYFAMWTYQAALGVPAVVLAALHAPVALIVSWVILGIVGLVYGTRRMTISMLTEKGNGKGFVAG